MIKRTHYSSELEGGEEDVTVAGWVHEIRDLGGVAFYVIRDRDGRLQVTLPRKSVDEKLSERFSGVGREDVVAVTGRVKEDDRAPGGFEVVPESLEIVSEAASPLPLDPTGKVGSEMDTRLDNRVMDLRRAEISSIFRVRHEALRLTREFLCSEGFVEVDTPKIVATATEGGTELFPITYFDREAFLNQSPQLYKQMLMAGGLDRVFEVGPIFRAEEHNTRRHLNESTSIDVEAAHHDAGDVMSTLEELILFVESGLTESAAGELEALDRDLEPPEPPLPRVTYGEAVEIAAGEGVDVEWGDDLSTAAERAVGERVGGYYFVTEWPADIKPFYVQPDGDVCHSFDLMRGGLELASGARRVSDVDLLLERIDAQGLDPEGFDFYVDAFRYGVPPHSGWGLGLERLLMSITGAENIRETVLFPRDRRRLSP